MVEIIKNAKLGNLKNEIVNFVKMHEKHLLTKNFENLQFENSKNKIFLDLILVQIFGFLKI